MSDTPLIRDGKLILRVVDHEDGTVTLKKPIPVKPEHIFRQTGAPGWDKRYVDQIFHSTPGNLEYTEGTSKFTIPHDVFIKHAYVTNHVVYGEQYHCEKQWYAEHPFMITEPVRGEFGRTIICAKCHGTSAEPGKRTKGTCPACMGIGVVPWKPISTKSG
jgi:DnaJ-class molecular chaperone